MKVIVHGGGNDRRRLAEAHELGIGCVEADVMLCRDGALCVHPQGHLPRRTPDGHLDYSLAEAQALVERSITLEDLLAELERRDMTALLETKVAGTVERIRGLLANHAPRITLLSFLGGELEAAGNLRRGCLIKHDPTPAVWRALHEAYGFTVYAPEQWYVSARTVDIAHRASVEVVCWDVDEPDHRERLRAIGVDAIISNEPRRML